MLKLSSNYAKSYIRDSTPQETQRARATTTERFYPPSSELYFDLPKKSMLVESDSRRERYDYKQSSNFDFKSDFAANDGKVGKERSYGYGYQNGTNPRNDDYRQELPQYSRKSKNYDESLGDVESNFRDKSPRTYNARRNSVAASYQLDLHSQLDQNFDPQGKSYKYSKYSARGSQPQSTYAFQKKDYTTKYSRRNQQVKNRILKQQNYAKDPYSKNFEDSKQILSYDNYLNDQQVYRQTRQEYANSQKHSKKLPFDAFDKQDDWKNSRKGYEIVNSQPYPEEIPLIIHKSDEYTQESRFDRPSLNERKESVKKSIEGTPQKGYKGKFEPGSAQRKNSLIQKSQMLQQKLKKLNMQHPGGQREKETIIIEQSYQNQRPVSRNQTNVNNKQEIYSRYTLSPHFQTSINNMSSNSLKNNFRNISIGQPQRETTASIRKMDNIRTKSPILDSQLQMQLPFKGEAIDKITKLNEKINQRIQSIISNYTKK